MERIPQEDLKAHLMATDEEFRRLAVEHAYYSRKLDELEAQPHLTELDEVEELRLKKLKLHLKDQMEMIVSRNRVQTVA
ncbi:MAG: DUF465 domain-containing protein [Bryobacterales bacterium]|nr:DUF465 domain-containing protein [Bryobacterales bacterium]